jgi:intracellular multiplication protein IcmK
MTAQLLPISAFALLLCLFGGSVRAYAQSREDAAHQQSADPILNPSIPVTPGMITDLQARVDQIDRAKAGVSDPNRIAMPISRSVNVTLAPGGVTNIIQTSEGFPSAVSFVDVTGEPWPIAWDVNSNPGGSCDKTGGGSAAVRATGLNACVPIQGSNVLQITPMSRYPRGGLIVTLKNAPKPIAFMVITGPGRYDADMTVRVSARGPNAKDAAVTEADAPATGAPFLTAMLDGTPPADAVPLKVTGMSPDDLRGWRIGHTMYLRTSASLVSPGSTESESEYGVTVYAIPETSVVLLSQNDHTISATLSDFGQ